MTKIAGYRCRECGQQFLPPRERCPSCDADAREEAEISGDGSIHSWTTIRVGPTRYESETPYTIVMVELDEGPRVMGRLAAGQQGDAGPRCNS